MFTYVAANPTVVTDDHRLSVFDILSPALNFSLVCGGEDGHIRTYHYAIATGSGLVSVYGDKCSVWLLTW